MIRHKKISYWKSGIRIVACIALLNFGITTAGLLLLIAEILGILEEKNEK